MPLQSMWLYCASLHLVAEWPTILVTKEGTIFQNFSCLDKGTQLLCSDMPPVVIIRLYVAFRRRGPVLVALWCRPRV